MATRTIWMKRVKDALDKNGRGGWSNDTFDRRLRKLREQGRVTSTGDLNNPQRGDEYSIAYSEQAKAARKIYGATGIEEGTVGVAGKVEWPAIGRNDQQAAVAGGLRESKAAENSVAISELAGLLNDKPVS
jgi:hypothetical protein